MNKQIKAISDKYNATISVIDLTDAINKITKIDNKIVNEMAARIVLGNALLMLEEKDIDSLIVSLNLNSNVKKIYSEIYGNKYIRNQIIIDDNKNSNLNKNTLEVSKYIEKSVSKSIIEIENENIDEIFIKYLKQSDQINSIMITIVKIKDNLEFLVAKGILIKSLPNINEKTKDINNLDWNKIRNELSTKKISSGLIDELFGKCKMMKCKSTFEYRCGCDEKKFIDLLMSQDKQQLKDLIKDDEEITICCNYCLKKTIIKTNDILYN